MVCALQSALCGVIPAGVLSSFDGADFATAPRLLSRPDIGLGYPFDGDGYLSKPPSGAINRAGALRRVLGENEIISRPVKAQ